MPAHQPTRIRWLTGALLAGVAASLLTPGAPPAMAAAERNLAAGASYTVTAHIPNDQLQQEADRHYPDSGGELTDGVTAEVAYVDPAWVGYLQQIGRTVVVDLGATRTVRSVSTDFLFYQSAAVFLPGKVRYSLSLDGVTWRVAGEVPGDNRGVANEHRAVSLSTTPTYARYVKVVFDTNGYTFVDELTVLGVDGRVPGAGPPRGPVDQPKPVTDQGYRQQGTQQVGGVHDMYLAHTYGSDHPWTDIGTWTAEDLLPIVAHVGRQGRPDGWMFDTVLWVAGGDPMAYYHRKSQWDDIIARQFMPGRNMDALETAMYTAKQALGEPSSRRKMKVVLPIPDPIFDAAEPWGVLDGETLDLNPGRVGEAKAAANRLKVVRWLVEESRARFEERRYEHLELVGFYWTRERIAPESSDSDLVREVSRWLHAQPGNPRLYWIPYYQAPGFQSWKSFGIDAAMLQPNYFFDSSLPLSRVDSTTALARWAGLGVEVEGDDAMLTDAAARQRYYDYLSIFQRDGADDAINGYYWGHRDTTLACARSNDPDVRRTYDTTYDYIRGSR